MGKIIVLEGIDGSGKSTQFRRLTERLRAEAFDFVTVAFPRYGEKSSAALEMYLRGELGSRPDDVNACAASALFCVDRLISYKTEPWGTFYDGGGIVLTDRYSTSNAVHQGAKLAKSERVDFFRWLYDFEYEKIQLPAPTRVLYMDISAQTALGRIKNRDAATDIHERDAEYIALCAECAHDAAEFYGWGRIDAERGEDEIHEDIYAAVRAAAED